jgi:hypothetical protein
LEIGINDWESTLIFEVSFYIGVFSLILENRRERKIFLPGLTPPCQMITNRCDLFTSRIIIGWDLEERKRYFNSQRNIILDFGGDKSFADDLNSNICLDEGLSHANVRISRFRQICGRLRKKGKKKGGETFVDNERKSFNNTKSVAMHV